jgi:hypothetical protein
LEQNIILLYVSRQSREVSTCLVFLDAIDENLSLLV